ncbi:MAG: hypothetical protein KUG74_09695 [Rhodobacteraceae bacterium]|nr:hypothetical protein [Paracoccaceae bacterium]
MIRQATVFLRYALTIALALGVLLSSYARITSHDVANLAQLSTEHHAEIKDHGRAHGEISDVMQAYHGHAHDVADHDHSIGFLPSRNVSGVRMPTRTNWALANDVLPDRKSVELDRPPRV